MRISEGVVLALIMGFVAGFFGFSMAHVAIGVSTQKQCQALGWPGADVTWDFSVRYCTRRIEQTDSIIPLNVLKELHR